MTPPQQSLHRYICLWLVLACALITADSSDAPIGYYPTAPSGNWDFTALAGHVACTPGVTIRYDDPDLLKTTFFVPGNLAGGNCPYPGPASDPVTHGAIYASRVLDVPAKVAAVFGIPCYRLQGTDVELNSLTCCYEQTHPVVVAADLKTLPPITCSIVPN